jgi:3-hydroxyacyl-[acyl-carrier-protein] dehydratase
MTLNSNEIQQIIPHRYPFLLVDRIVEMELGKRAVGIKCVTANEMHFVGHFPEHHVMPGVLIVEACAQVGAVAILSMEEYKGRIAFFAGIDNAKFRRQVIPGDQLRLEIEFTKMRGRIGVGEAKAYVGEELAFQGTLKFAIGDEPAK